ncbi:sulfate ABC transporter permease subunit CysT [Kaistia terrae]|uniref:Sulfate transport system permease protein CysT n=1 Tax=Kaistia terrae TaxID=537017 RepID=A0ABW0PX83_9HYPH|nr:sulfate ABC transporter permease subunit CysT [Kaistia terrae]MCX5580829.1 sulfate ABC transporter permease subunit CysT [Kaistia terrae]
MAATTIATVRKSSVIPGFGLALGVTLTYLSLIVLIPLALLFWRSASGGPEEFIRISTDPRTIAALRLSFTTSFIAALVNLVFGMILAWILVRYEFPGRRLIDAVIDLPFALPTAVAGIALTTLYAPNGWIGAWLQPFGIRIAYSQTGIIIALIFIGLPFVVRSVQPVLEDLNREVEEVAATLGANRRQTVRRVVMPALMPALLTGFALAFARAVGEYGSVIFIAGNSPYKTEIAPLLIVIKLEEFSYSGATTIAVLMLIASFLVLLAIHLIQSWSRRRYGDV